MTGKFKLALLSIAVLVLTSFALAAAEVINEKRLVGNKSSPRRLVKRNPSMASSLRVAVGKSGQQFRQIAGTQAERSGGRVKEVFSKEEQVEKAGVPEAPQQSYWLQTSFLGLEETQPRMLPKA